MNHTELKSFLDAKAEEYERNFFIETDPIQIPHQFSKKEDIEIAGFLTSVIAWGQRKTIIQNAQKLMKWMDDSPYDFILNFEDEDLKSFENFVHRTFNGSDCIFFLHSLQKIYRNQGGLEEVIAYSFANENKEAGSGWHQFKRKFFESEHLKRTEKHLPDPLKGSAAKRMNMYLRWMVRNSSKGVDFGIWNKVSPASLYIPLDVHTSTVARKLKLLKRKQDDWKSVIELSNKLRKMEPADPVKYDFALFGLGAFEKF